jgi:hypothetical protein
MEWNDFKCNICKKFYKTYKSLWNHNKNYHKNDNSRNLLKSPQISSKIPQNPQKDEDISTLNCRHCNKNLSRIDNLKRHEEKCKEKDKGKNKIRELESKISEMFDNQKEMLKLIKIHPKTLNKINKQLNNNGTINNGIINNTINIIPIGKENLNDVLSNKQKLMVLKSNTPHIAFTDLIYSEPELEKFRNIYVTNLANDIAYVFDESKNQYIVKSKKNIMNSYSTERIWDIEAFLNDLRNKLDEKSINKLVAYIDNFFKDDDFNDKIKKELLLTLYNNKVNVREIYEKINDIEL